MEGASILERGVFTTSAPGDFNSQTTDGTAQTRTHNEQNEIGGATGQTTPTYNAAGDQTRDFGNRAYTYDAWGRP